MRRNAQRVPMSGRNPQRAGPAESYRKDIMLLDKSQFKSVELSDREILLPYYRKLNSRSCDDCFSNLYLWKHLEPMEYQIADGVVILKSKTPKFYFRFPMGPEEKIPEALDAMEAYAKAEGAAFLLRLVTREQYEVMERLCPGKYHFEETRDFWDYVYDTEKLTNLSGRKYHGKKNHINKFLRDYQDWSYEPITDANVEECFQMGLKWRVLNNCDELFEKRIEMCVALNSLRLLKELQLTGGLLRVNGNVAAYTIGEKVNEDTFVVHIEKALTDVEGAYTVINQQFVEHEMGGIPYVNREDDTGDEGLREAKESYHPVMMVEKGEVTLS